MSISSTTSRSLVLIAVLLTGLTSVNTVHGEYYDQIAQSGYGGQWHVRVTVCKPTGSRFKPYIKVTVPQSIAGRILAQGGVLPDHSGKCPQGISLRDYIKERRTNLSWWFHNWHFSFR